MGTVETIYRGVKHVLWRLAEPLTADDSIEHFTLSIPDAQTTTVDSVQGWANRPPAGLRCPGCDAEIVQYNARATIDCTNCFRDFRSDEFGDLELLRMTCPRCNAEMTHGTRHPKVFDVPEYATCPDCQYHWDLDHWF